MKKLLLLSVLLTGSLFYAQDSFTGRGFQKNINDYWDFTLERSSDGNFTVVYPELGCSSVWTHKGKEDDFEIYQEKLTSGFDKCKDGDYIYITDDMMGSSTQYFYIYDKIGDQVETAYGTIDIAEK